MNGVNLVAVFIIGLLGSIHCVGMCGGIVAAISVVSTPFQRFPVAVVADNRVAISAIFSRVVAYNLGRIGSYVVAGALVGGLARSAGALMGLTAIQTYAYWLVNLLLMALGLYLMGLLPGFAYLEFAGHGLWKRLQPWTKKLLPLDRNWKLFAAGAVWGWLPCGMVYSMLLTALLSGSALAGACVMLAFGLGTLPTLLTMGLMGAKLKLWMQRRSVRLAAGLIVLSFGLLGLLRTLHGMSALDTFCLTPITGLR